MEGIEDFISAEIDGWFVVARKGFHGKLLEVIKNGEKIAGGRGFILRYGGIVGRLYRRGGLLGNLFKYPFFFEYKRPFEELKIHLYAFKNKIYVPEPMGYAMKRNGLFLRAFFFSSYIEGIGLERAMSGDRENLLKKIGESIRKLHDISVYHSDLNVRNFLISGGRVYMLDFDKSRMENMSRKKRLLNLERFLRSLCKEDLYKSGDEELIIEGYGMDLPLKRKKYWRFLWALGL